MTIPANLFVEAPDVQDRALTKLDTDMNSWPEELIQKLRERVPQTAGMSCMVKFMKKDEEGGHATGSIIINTHDAAVIVPVIIKDYTLYPLDVMIAKSKILPLTQDYLNSVTSKNQVFDKIEEYPTYGGLGRFEDANLWNAMYPPSLGRYAYASAGYPMLEMLADGIDGSPLKEWIKLNPQYAVGFQKYGHADLINKLANLKPVNMNEYSQGVHKLLPRSIRMLKFEGPDKYSLLSSSDKVFSPALEHCSRSMAMNILSTISDHAEDDMNDVDQNGEKMLSIPPQVPGAIIARTDNEQPEQAKEYDHYVVKNNHGLSVEGVVIPKVIDFDQKSVDLKIFLGTTMSTVQQDIWGIRQKNSRFKPKCAPPRVGQTGTFLYKPDESHAIATIPVTIRTVSAGEEGYKLEALDLTGRGYHFTINPKLGLKRIARLRDGSYLLPKEMHWCIMEGFGEVSNSAASYLVKTASHTLTDKPVTIIPTGYDFYSMRGVKKYAQAAGWDETNMSKSQTTFLLHVLGCGSEKIAQAFDVARRKGHAELHGLNFIPTVQDKIAEYRPAAATLRKHALATKRNLIKEASMVDDAQTVDALLSLNFVNPTNISKFVGKIPHFKATISNLSSALLASRLGVQDIPEEACSVAVEKLIEVVDGLERLRASQEVQGQ